MIFLPLYMWAENKNNKDFSWLWIMFLFLEKSTKCWIAYCLLSVVFSSERIKSKNDVFFSIEKAKEMEQPEQRKKTGDYRFS